MGKGTALKRSRWVEVAFVAVFLGMATLFVTPAEAQQVQIDFPGQQHIENALPGAPTGISGTPGTLITDGALSGGDTLFRNIIFFVLRALQIAAVAYVVFIGAQMVTHVGNEDLMAKKRPALAFAVVGFIVMSVGDTALNIFNPANFQTGNTIEGQLTGGIAEVLRDSVIPLIRYIMWITAVVLVVLTGYRMVVSQDKDITQPRQQLLWIGIGLFVIQIADFIVRPFFGNQTTTNQVEAGNELIANLLNVMMTFFAPAAFFMFLYGAFTLVTANGDESKLKTARNIIVGTVIAVVITFSAYTLVRELTTSFTS